MVYYVTRKGLKKLEDEVNAYLERLTESRAN